MYAFLQRNICPCCGGWHSGKIRSGPEAKAWGCNWDAECTVDTTGTLAVIEAYWGSGKFTRERQDVIVDLVNRETGKKVYWERRGTNPSTALQLSGGNSEGRITMSHDHKHKHQAVADKFKPDGSIDESTAKQNVAAYNDAVQTGKVKILAVGDSVPVPGLPGVVAKLVVMKE